MRKMLNGSETCLKRGPTGYLLEDVIPIFRKTLSDEAAPVGGRRARIV